MEAKNPQPSIIFKSLRFSDGTIIELTENDIIVLVGPNNAGKSAALFDMENIIAHGKYGKIIKHASCTKKGGSDDVKKLIKEKYKLIGDHYMGMSLAIYEGAIDSIRWETENCRIQGLSNIFCKRLTTESRISSSNPVANIDTLKQAPQHPIHLIHEDPDGVGERLNKYFKRAFEKEIYPYYGGSHCHLLIGKKPRLCNGEDRVSKSYKEKQLNSMSPIEEQGGGMRSFASIVLEILTHDTYSIILLDEPEAFLHPPQARIIGEIIAKERQKGTQIFVATHSQDILMGLLNAAPNNLRILRIEREGDINKITELKRESITEFYSNPLLKHSSAISGIFYKRVIICESDSDCQFYNAILNTPDIVGDSYPDVLFVHASGKDRIHILAKMLWQLGVKVDVIVDIDIIKESKTLRNLYESLGGKEWGKIEKALHRIKKDIESKRGEVSADLIKSEIEKEMGDIDDKNVIEKLNLIKKKAASYIRSISPWQHVKESGERAIPRGEAMQKYKEIKDSLQKVGIWIVPVGEVEGFCKSIGGHGPSWVRQVLESKDLEGEEFKEAREFIAKIWNY